MKCFAKFAIVAISLFAAWSCTEDPIEVPVSKSEETFSMSFSADIFDIDTKATLETTDEINFKAAWEDGDMLDITSANGLVDHLTAIWDAANKMFVINDIPVELKGQKINIHAIYPKTAPAQTRTQTGGVYNDEYDTMEGDAEFEFSTTATGNIVQMQRITAILYFHLTSELNDEISSAKLTVGDQEISTGYVDVNADDAVLWFNISPVENAAISLELTSKNGNTLTLNRKSTATYVAGKVYTIKKKVEWVAPVPEYYFYESFDKCSGTGGNDDKWSGSIASNKLEADNVGWSFVSGNGANQCARFGTGSVKGTATTPSITISGNATLKFKAAAWGTSDNKELILSATGCSLSKYSVTMKNSEWSDFSIDISYVSEAITITFEGKNKSDSRFFLDDIIIEKSTEPVVIKYDVNCAEVTGGSISVSTSKAEEGSEVTLTATPATGYEFESWNVTNASTSEAIIVSEDNKFTMPAANVIVSATFKTIPISDKTIAQFIAAKGGDCYLTGVVSNIQNTTYGNFDLTDESGTIFVYGCLTPEGVAQKFSDLDVEAGDKIKVHANEYKLYNGTHEAINVVFFEIIKKATKYNVAVADGILNGTVTVNPTQAVEGQTVTITATPASGYKVKSVSAKTASGNALTVTNNKFTMPAEAVTVSAEFEESTDTEYTTVFSNSSWNNTTGDTMSWSAGKNGGFVTDRGVQVTTTNTGANATTKQAFANVSRIVVTYSTNASNGVGTINAKVGSGSEKTFNVTKPSSGGTTDKEAVFTFDPSENGQVTLKITCTTNSVYIKKVVVTAAGVN